MNDLFLKIINMSISASWLVLAVLLLRFVLKKAPKWVNVLLWGIVAVRLAFPFSIESALSLIPSAETVPMDIEMAVQPTINSGVPVINSMVNPMLSSFAPPQDVLTSANPLQIWIPIFSILWIAGIAALLLYTVVSYWRLRRKVSEAVILRDNIFQSENVASPFVLGVFRPKIYLPYNMGGQDLNHVVAHEQAHIRRRDHWWKPLGFLLLTIHWFNPLMWLAYVLLCRDIELACDEKVIKVLGNEQRADYTQALVACSVNRRVIAACPLAFGEVGVKERVKSVMNYKKPAFWVVVLAVIACVVVAVCFLTDPEQDSYTLRIVVPAGSQDDFVYSDEEVSTTGNSIVICSGFLTLPFVGIFAEHLIKLLFQLPAFCRFLLRREHRGEIFQCDFLSLKSHDFDFLFVSDITYKITFPFHAAAVAVSVPLKSPAGYGQPAAAYRPVRFLTSPVPSCHSSCLFRWPLP